MTNDEAIKLLMSMKDGIIHVFDGDRMIALEMAISALQAQDVPDTNDGDLISRQAAIEAAIKATDDWDGGYNITRANMIEKELNDLPSAEPEETCTSCLYRELDWHDEPCYSCTREGDSNHYKRRTDGQTDWCSRAERSENGG